MNCQSFISSSINYHLSAKFSVTTLAIAFRKIQIVKKHLRNALYLYSIKYRQVLKSSVSTLVIASQRFENIKSVCLHFLSFHKLLTIQKSSVIACLSCFESFQIIQLKASEHLKTKVEISFFINYIRDRKRPEWPYLSRFQAFKHLKNKSGNALNIVIQHYII